MCQNCWFRSCQILRAASQELHSRSCYSLVQSTRSIARIKSIQHWYRYLVRWLHFLWACSQTASVLRREWDWLDLQNFQMFGYTIWRLMVRIKRSARDEDFFPKMESQRRREPGKVMHQLLERPKCHGLTHLDDASRAIQKNHSERSLSPSIF